MCSHSTKTESKAGTVFITHMSRQRVRLAPYEQTKSETSLPPLGYQLLWLDGSSSTDSCIKCLGYSTKRKKSEILSERRDPKIRRKSWVAQIKMKRKDSQKADEENN